MIEVEVKLPLFRRSHTEQQLISLGFSPGDLVRESDVYFNSDFHDFRQTDEALRIRTSENLTKRTAHSVITYKGKKLDSLTMTRKELETGLDDPGTGIDILKALGYNQLYPVRKLRQYYHLDRVTACVDQVEGLGSFLELEVLVPEEKDRPQAMEEIEKILHGICSSLDETIRISYLSMLMKKDLRQAESPAKG